jgi:hypothetical protein
MRLGDGDLATKKDNGKVLENRVGRIQFGAGSFTRLRVPVKALASQGRKILTDIDVLAVDVDHRLRSSLSIYECKSGGGETGEPDRLFWLAGFSRYLHADKAVLVRTSVSSRGRELARRLGLETFDEVTLVRRESANAWLPDAFAHIGGLACDQAERSATEVLKKLGGVPDEVSYLRDVAFLAPPHRALGAVAQLNTILTNLGVLPGPAGFVVAGHGLVALIFATIRMAADLDATPASEVRRRLEVGWMTGDPADTQVVKVLRAADDFFAHQVSTVHQAYVDAGAKRLKLPIESVADSILDVPSWSDRLMDLAERFRDSSAVARELPLTVELGVFDALAGDSNWKAEAFDSLFSLEHKQLLVATLQLYESIAGEHVVRYLQDLIDLPFDRSAPRLSERRTPFEGAPDDGQHAVKANADDPKLFGGD